MLISVGILDAPVSLTTADSLAAGFRRCRQARSMQRVEQGDDAGGAGIRLANGHLADGRRDRAFAMMAA